MIHDVLNLSSILTMLSTCPRSLTMFSTCLQSSRCYRPVLDLSRCCRPVVFVAPEGRWLKSHSSATLNANLERPPAVRQPALHSCIHAQLRSECLTRRSCGKRCCPIHSARLLTDDPAPTVGPDRIALVDVDPVSRDQWSTRLGHARVPITVFENLQFIHVLYFKLSCSLDHLRVQWQSSASVSEPLSTVRGCQGLSVLSRRDSSSRLLQSRRSFHC